MDIKAHVGKTDGSEQANQCDGCMAGMALKEGNLHTDYSGNVVMVCQSDRYRVKQGGEA